MSTSHIGFAGTNYDERMEVAEKVISENPDSMVVSILGKTFELEKEQSLSGKTVWYRSEISLDDFMLISGYALPPFGKNEGKFYLQINGDMRVELQKFSRRNENSQWKFRGSKYVGEEFVTIMSNEDMEKEDILKLFDSIFGSYTPAYVCDKNGYNGSYEMMNVDELISGGEYCTPLAQMNFLSYKKAECEDIEVWAQEADDEERESLKETMKEGKLYIASFSDERASMDIMFWK